MIMIFIFSLSLFLEGDVIEMTLLFQVIEKASRKKENETFRLEYKLFSLFMFSSGYFFLIYHFHHKVFHLGTAMMTRHCPASRHVMMMKHDKMNLCHCHPSYCGLLSGSASLTLTCLLILTCRPRRLVAMIYLSLTNKFHKIYFCFLAYPPLSSTRQNTMIYLPLSDKFYKI